MTAFLSTVLGHTVIFWGMGNGGWIVTALCDRTVVKDRG